MAFFERANLRIEKKAEESAVLLLDVAGRTVNVFHREVLTDLDAAHDCLANAPSLKLLGIRSGSFSKPIVGADIPSFAGIKHAEHAPARSAPAQRVFDKLPQLAIR